MAEDPRVAYAQDKPPARGRATAGGAKKPGRAKAAGSAVGAAKGTGEAAPVVAVGAYAKEWHKQRAEERAEAREKRAAESHAARQQDRSAKLSPPSVPKAKRFAGWAWSGSRQVLTAEFLLCVMVLLVGYLLQRVDAKATESKDSTPAPGTSSHDSAIHVMVKGSALAGVFFLLALLQAGGKDSGAAKAATGLGTLVTATYVLTSTDVHAIAGWLNQFFTKPKTSDTSTPSGSGNG